MSVQFERLAAAVTRRVSDLLCAQVYVIDQHGTVITTSEPGPAGAPWDMLAETPHQLRIPLSMGLESGEVIVGSPSNGETVPPRVAQVLVELVIHEAAVADRLVNQTELKNRLIHNLLHGLIKDESAILREAKVLGMDLNPPRAVVLIDASDYILAPPSSGRTEPSDAQLRRRAQFVIGSVVSFFHLPNDTICAYIGDGEVAVLKASNTRNLASWADHTDGEDQPNSSWANLVALKRAAAGLLQRLRSDSGAPMGIGIGRYHPGIHGLARSYQDARAALSLGRRFHGQNSVHCLDALGIAAFIGVADEQTKVDLATYLLSPLDHEPELLETLDVFLSEDCCPSSTSARLSIHRNTLAYRLDKITSLTGLNPRRFDDAVQIRLALLLRSLRERPA